MYLIIYHKESVLKTIDNISILQAKDFVNEKFVFDTKYEFEHITINDKNIVNSTKIQLEKK